MVNQYAAKVKLQEIIILTIIINYYYSYYSSRYS